MQDKIKVLIIDDNLSIRLFLKSLLAKQPDIEVVGAAQDPLEAQPLISFHKPDVLTLDVEMPRMDGLTFLEKLMRLKPIPVVMFSTLTHKGSEAALKALSLGAVEVVGKPSSGEDLSALAEDILMSLRSAARAKVNGKASRFAALQDALTDNSNQTLDTVLPRTQTKTSTEPLIVIGASTGGTEALRQIIQGLHANLPPIVIVQHMPEGFTASLAERLNKAGAVRVSEAKHHEVLLPGHAYIAPGGKSHLTLEATSTGFRTTLIPADKVNRRRPSVDILFRATTNCARGNITAVLLTGMGNDGAQGLKELYDLGANTIAQDEASCVVYGMPRAAVELKAAKHVMPPQQITQMLNQQGIK